MYKLVYIEAECTVSDDWYQVLSLAAVLRRIRGLTAVHYVHFDWNCSVRLYVFLVPAMVTGRHLSFAKDY